MVIKSAFDLSTSRLAAKHGPSLFKKSAPNPVSPSTPAYAPSPHPLKLPYQLKRFILRQTTPNQKLVVIVIQPPNGKFRLFPTGSFFCFFLAFPVRHHCLQ
jgi:hypothetical protein